MKEIESVMSFAEGIIISVYENTEWRKYTLSNGVTFTIQLDCDWQPEGEELFEIDATVGVDSPIHNELNDDTDWWSLDDGWGDETLTGEIRTRVPLDGIRSAIKWLEGMKYEI